MSEEKPKIIVDDDWKKQAQAEKEQLDQKVKSEPKPAAAAGKAAPGQARGPRELPPADFATLVNSLASQIMMSLGGVQDPQTGQRHLDLAAAKFHIDMLTMLEEKTHGNLTDDEKKLLDSYLYQLRMIYLEESGKAGDSSSTASGPSTDANNN